jgi:hypothetical protein
VLVLPLRGMDCYGWVIAASETADWRFIVWFTSNFRFGFKFHYPWLERCGTWINKHGLKMIRTHAREIKNPWGHGSSVSVCISSSQNPRLWTQYEKLTVAEDINLHFTDHL